MYKHYESSDDVFVDREEHIEWMNEALERCGKESVVLHLKGIGGIGKSSLLNHWVNTHERSIRLDCYQYSDFFQRLNILAKGAVLQGIKLHRFDILWQIRQRFVEGVEPVKEEGRQWAKEVVMAIPFIGSLATIGSAINAVGAKVTPKFKGKYGTIGKWLQEQLGRDHIEKLLEILWKDPRRAEFLFLEAFLEDINSRDNPSIPILFLLDHFEHVDDQKTQWRFMKKRISESGLWTIFLSNLSNCVGVLASRRSAAKVKPMRIEETELLELDRDSCIEMLDLQDVTDKELQEKIVSVSGGNPFVIDAICDMINTSEVSMSDIENLRADDLSEVRLKVWRRLFSQAEGLHSLINRVGILPHFDEQIIGIIASDMTTDNWDRLRRLSFVREREDNTFVLHELAQELVRAELGEKLKKLALEIGGLLEIASKDQTDYNILGLSLSVQALADELDTTLKIDSILDNLLFHNDTESALNLLDNLKIDSDTGLIFRGTWGSYVLFNAGRLSEAEDTIDIAVDNALRLSRQKRPDNALHLSRAYFFQARLYQHTLRYYEAEDAFRKVLELLAEYSSSDLRESFLREDILMGTNYYLGQLITMLYRLDEAEVLIRKSIDQIETEYWKAYYTPEEAQAWKNYLLCGLSRVLDFSGRLYESENILKKVLKSCSEIVNENEALNRLFTTLRFQHRYNDQIEFVEKLLVNNQQLAQQNPDHRIQVIGNMAFLAMALARTGQYQKAFQTYQDVIESYRIKVSEDKHYQINLAKVLWEYASLLCLSDRLEEAESVILESIELLKELVEFYPERYIQILAAAMNNHGIISMRMDKIDDAQEILLESHNLAKENFTKNSQAVYLAEVYGISTNNVGAYFWRNKKLDVAENYIVEAHKILEKYAEISPEMFRFHIGIVLNNFAVLLSETDRKSKAKTKFNTALEIRREYVKNSENFFLPRVASVLSNLGILNRRTGQLKESEKVYKEALKIMEPFAEEEPAVHKTAFTQILNNSLILYSETNDSTAIESTRARLKEIGVEEPLSEERWFVDMEYLSGY